MSLHLAEIGRQVAPGISAAKCGQKTESTLAVVFN
jgi:hypothetical protein